MSEVKSFNQWMVDQGFNAIRHANCCRIAFDAGSELQQAETNQLKAKNTQLTHALVNANAEKSKWQKDYWGQVERSAEYGAMLMTDPDSLEFKCYQKEKQNEELVKQLKIQQVILSALKPRLHKTDMGGCLHFSTTMFHEGKAECFACGAVVNHERKVIGVMKR